MFGVTGILNVLFVTNDLSDFDERLQLVIQKELGIEIKLKLYLLQGKDYKKHHKNLKKSITLYDFIIFSAQKQVEDSHIIKVLNYIPAEKLILLHSDEKWLKANVSTICRDEKQDIFNALVSLICTISFKKIILLKEEARLFSKQLLKGISDFADSYKLEVLLSSYNELVLSADYLYILCNEQELYKFLKILQKQNGEFPEAHLLSLSNSHYREVLPSFIHYLAPDVSKTGKLIAEIMQNGGIQHKITASSFVKRLTY